MASNPTIIGTPVSQLFTTGASTFTQAITIPNTGQNTSLIVVCNHLGSSTNQTGVTYNGNAMTHIVNIAASTELNGSMWFLAAPTATTANIVVTPSGVQNNFFLVAFALQDCVQSSGSVLDVVTHGTAGTGTSASLAATTTVAGDFMVIWIGGNPTLTSFVAGGTQTNQGNTTLNTSGSMAVSTDSFASIGSYTGSYSWTGLSDYDIYVAGLKYQAPAGTVVTASTMMMMGV